MEITSAVYTADGSITAMIDGVEMTVPAIEGNRHYDAIVAQGIEIAPHVAQAAPEPVPVLTRSAFCVALTKDHLPPLPPIFTAAEALAALENFPPKFTAALAGKPLEYQAAAIEAWRETKTVARNAPLFLDLLAFYAAQAGLTDAQAEALGDSIFAGAE